MSKNIATLKAEKPGLPASEYSKIISHQWHSLDEASKAEYAEESKRLLDQYQEDLRKWKDTHTEIQVAEWAETKFQAEFMRFAKQEKEIVNKVKHALDENPTPLSPFLAFLRLSDPMKGESFQDFVHRKAKDYFLLPDFELRPLLKTAKDDLKRFDAACQAFKEARLEHKKQRQLLQSLRKIR